MINEIFPFFLYFLLILFYLASIKNKKIKNISKNQLQTKDNDIKSFLLDSEKKLLALRELYKQELINYELYLRKSNQIGEIVKKLTNDDIFKYGKFKNQEVINELKTELTNKIHTNKLIKIKTLDFDTALDSIDQKISKKIKEIENER